MDKYIGSVTHYQVNMQRDKNHYTQKPRNYYQNDTSSSPLIFHYAFGQIISALIFDEFFSRRLLDMY